MIQTKQKIVDLDELQRLRTIWKQKSLKVVFTNGCFDILHPGHVIYLERAKKLGDKMIIGLNSDDSVKRLKGNERPVNPFNDRAVLLAAFAFVDAVVKFEEDTPLKLIKLLNPDVLVKGKDYDISNIVGADYVVANGGTVETIKLEKSYSTTSIIKKIKSIK